MEINSKIYIAGHRGMVGSALQRKLEKEGFTNFITRTSSEIDLRNQNKLTVFLSRNSCLCIFSCCKSWGFLPVILQKPAII